MTSKKGVSCISSASSATIALSGILGLAAACGQVSEPKFSGSSKLYYPPGITPNDQGADANRAVITDKAEEVKPNSEQDSDDPTPDTVNHLPPNSKAGLTVSTVKSQREVDLLWVVDTSNSMAEEQALLAEGFQEFVAGLQSLNIRFQTALTSTDVCESLSDGSQKITPECPADSGGSTKTRLRGSFVGDKGRTVLKGTDPDVLSKFTSYARSMGVEGSGFEHGLSAANLAVKKSLSGLNEPFIRKDAFLSIIVVSDEEDDGIGLGLFDKSSNINYVAEGLTNWRYDHLDFIRDMNAVKGPGNFSVNAITGTRDDKGVLCSSPYGSPAEEGTQYIAAAKATGGNIESICSKKWDTLLKKIAGNIKTQISQIKLIDSNVIKNTVEIYVDGDKLNPKYWTYIADQNSVSFPSFYNPPLGSKIEIKYFTATN
ncbi:MAG: hypothetical protein WCI18_03210 [Pseudomonadota bacterium]